MITNLLKVMKREVSKIIKELLVAFTIVFIFLFLASSVISSYEKVDIAKAFEITLFHIVSAAGEPANLSNFFYLTIIFITLGVIYYMFEKFVDLMTELEIGGALMRTKISMLKDHYIICGAGRVGLHAAKKLKEEGKKFVIIESNSEIAKVAKEKGFLVIEGDCLKEDILKKARIKKAKGLLACMGRDDANVFVTLTAKDLNPKIKVASRVNNLDVLGEFKRAGADYIVAPEVTGGFELAEKILEL